TSSNRLHTRALSATEDKIDPCGGKSARLGKTVTRRQTLRPGEDSPSCATKKDSHCNRGSKSSRKACVPQQRTIKSHSTDSVPRVENICLEADKSPPELAKSATFGGIFTSYRQAFV